MTKPQWIVFDVGGVLLDWRASSAALAKKIGIDKRSLLEVLFKTAPGMNVGQTTQQDGWRDILSSFNSTVTPEEALQIWISPDFWFRDSLKLLGELKKSNYKLALFTNSWLGLSSHSEKFPAALKSVDFIIDSSKEGLAKPSLKLYKKVESLLGQSGEVILFIDDDKANLIPALNLGWQVYEYKYGSVQDHIYNNNYLRTLLLK